MTAAEVAVADAYARLAALDDPAAVISLVPVETAMAKAAAVGDPSLPLHGTTFVVKDNIDVEGVPTTAGCPAFAYTPARSAEVVRRLEAAGAVVVGKTNMDQFATGLVGTRSPYGTPRNPWDPTRVPGGSSSGSAVLVARGAVTFSLGTDTAGSGRVPAAFCGIVGAKPTRGWLSTRGVVPAVRTMDCVSVFSRSVAGARTVLEVAGGFDPDDPFSRPPAPRLPGARVTDRVDLAPLLAAGRLLYGGPYVAERVAAVGDFVAAHPDDVDPSVRAIIQGAARWTAADAARAAYELADLRRRVDRVWEEYDAIVMPAVPGRPPTLAEVAADPIGANAALGRYTTFTNLLDLCAVVVPTGVDDEGLPTSAQVVGPAWADQTVLSVAERIHAAAGDRPGPAAAEDGAAAVELAVAGAHLRGQPLHHQLAELGAVFSASTRTAPCYRLFALAGTTPPKPGLVRTASGAPIAVEVYRLGVEALGRLVASVPPPMCIGTVELETGRAAGFLCEPAGLDGATDITAFGGWLAYLESTRSGDQGIAE